MIAVSKVRLGACAAMTLSLVVHAAAVAVPAQEPGRVARAKVVDQIGALVEQNFFSRERLDEVGWGAAVERTRRAVATKDDAGAETAIRELVATLRTSHTAYYPRSDPAYWQFASIFERYLKQACPKELIPRFPITREDIGVFWKHTDEGWFVGGLFAGGVAEKAGMMLGDRVALADGRPFSPVGSLAGRERKPVTLTVQRDRGGAMIAIEVTPRSSRPVEELRRATADSWGVLEHNGRRVGYLHVWSWVTIAFQEVVLDAITRFNAARVDAVILDLRDGWGGASANYLSIFVRDLPRLESIGRDGRSQPFDPQIRTPAVLLVNGGTRSGKETIAFGAKKHHLARLVGERTAGAYLFGRPFCLYDRSLLLLAVSDARVDGERIEGVGVEPDVDVPFDFRYAAGKDAQLDRALEELASGAQ